MPFGRKAIGELCIALGRPALECPARGGMHVNEWLRQRELGDLALRLRPGHELKCTLGETRIDADTPQRIQVHFDLMAAADQRVEMREAAPPPPAALGHLRRDAMANAQQTRKPGASRM